jgi:hypothetical protein
MEQELSTGLCKGQIGKFVEQHKIKTGHVVGNATLLADTRLAFQSIDQIDHIEETASQSSPDAGAGNGDGQMGLSRARATNQYGVTLIGNKGACSQVPEPLSLRHTPSNPEGRTQFLNGAPLRQAPGCGPEPAHNARDHKWYLRV